LAGHCFNESGIVGDIAQSGAQLLDGSVQAIIKLDIGICRPELLSNLVSRDNFAPPLQEKCEHLKGLTLKLDAKAPLGQQSLLKIGFEQAEADQLSLRRRKTHTSRPKNLAEIVARAVQKFE